MSHQEHITLPSRLEAESVDLAIITVLRSGRHLWYTNMVREGDDPERMVATHCQVRGFYHQGHVERFVVICGADVRTVEVPHG